MPTKPGIVLWSAAVMSVLGASLGCAGEIGALEGEAPARPPTLPGSLAIDIAVSSHLVRLSASQWRNAARDALGADDALVQGLLPFPTSPTGYDTENAAYIVGAGEYATLANSADALATRTVANASLLAKLTGGAGGKAAATALLKGVGRRAFRGTLAADDIASYEALYDRSLALADSPAVAHSYALIQMLSALFQSPDFAYRAEYGDGDGQVVRIKGAELAAKLSFALWNTGPTDELLDLAEKGGLDMPEGYTAAVSSMLKDPKVGDVLMRFHASMLGTERIAALSRDTSKFPRAYAGYGKDMAEELSRFVKFVVVDESDGGNWKGLLTSRTAFVNQGMAKLYNVPESAAPELSDPSKWARVSLPESERAGIATRAGIMSYYSNGTNPSSVLRGEFMVKKIACLKVGLLENKILPTFDSGGEPTNRKRVEAKTGSCGAGCHGNGRDIPGVLGPMGFAFEGYDAAGVFRDKDGGEAIDASSTLAPFGKFASAVELMGKVADTEASHQCYAGQWATYLLGRAASAGELPVVNDAAKKSLAGDKVRDILRAMVMSDLFLTRKNES